MCGICGKLNFASSRTVSSGLLKTMADTIRHRGPDDDGYYTSGPVGLGFRRLSIIDLAKGHQPISNETADVWTVFNGEIYNYQELRDYLLTKGHVFRTQTDTEVIVHLYEEFGEAFVEKLRGMFAIALWDERQQVLLLIRDRVGIKPLYYSISDKSLVFASEIKAILADAEVPREVAPQVIDRFLTFYYVPGAETLLNGVLKLPPGSYMRVRDGQVQIKQYWDLHFEPTISDPRQAEEKLLALLDECVRMHMISDVPVGFLLSGGVDSTAMLSFAADKTPHALSAFTIGFDSPGVTDERPYAQLAAKKFGAVYHEMTIGSKDFADFLPSYMWYMEEPVCEAPAVALYYVSKLAKDFVKVLLSGEGGDEAFAGYPNYRSLPWLERLKSVLRPLNGLPSSSLLLLNRVLHSKYVAKYAPLMTVPFDSYYHSRTATPFSFFNRSTTQLYSKDFAAFTDKEWSTNGARLYAASGNASGTLNKMLYVDFKTWLPDDLLLKADKMTMANSVELRVPLLDHVLLEFAASLAESLKVRRFSTKYIFKQALKKRIPQEILGRKKVGFPVPYDSWLQNELNNWVRDVLLDRTALARGYFNKNALETLLKQNKESGSYPKEVLSLIMLELWHRIFLSGTSMCAPPTLTPSVAAYH